MSVEENQAIARRFLEDLWNKGNLTIADELVSAGFVNHNPPPGATPDREGIKRSVSDFHTGFSDLAFITEDLIAENDKIVMRGTFRGTHTGEFAGISATGAETTWTWIVVLRVKGGKIVERWINFDELGFFQQLGVIPPLGEG